MGVYAMMFPDTVEEFMEEYKMVDREQIYSNGCEYVPIYRMKQWFAHKPQIDLVRCGECKYLEVINKAPIYAHCHKWDYDFELWQEDTRTNFCSWGERRAE